MSEMILDATQLPDPETMPIEDMDVSHPILLQQHVAALFQTTARRRSRPLLQRQYVWSLLVGDEI